MRENPISIIIKYSTKTKHISYIIFSSIMLIGCTSSIEIAINSENWFDRANALEQITEQNILKDIVKNDESDFVRLAAIKRITDQKYLMDIFNNDKEYYLTRGTAAEGLIDKELLLDIYKNRNEKNELRSAAVMGLNNQKLLGYIASDGNEYWLVRESAISVSTDQELLFRIAKTDEQKDLYNFGHYFIERARILAISNMNILNDLVEIAQTDKEEIIKLTAACRIQFLLNKSHKFVPEYVDIKFKRVMLILLEPAVIKRNGLLRLDYTVKIKRTQYEKIGYVGQLFNEDYFINIKDSSGNILLERSYLSIKPRKSAKFYTSNLTRRNEGKIDYDEIRETLLNIDN